MSEQAAMGSKRAEIADLFVTMVDACDNPDSAKLSGYPVAG
jgi:hypothetical protein